MSEYSIACIGECMLELTPSDSETTLRKGFAGDTFNTAHYLKRILGQEAAVSYVSAVGDDPISLELIARLQLSGLDTQWIRRLSGKTIGLYLVDNDKDGERHFTYWRSDSAARLMFQGPEGQGLLDQLNSCDVVYLSGISLAILTAQDSVRLIEALLSYDGLVVFDPNYRPSLWASAEEASLVLRDLVKTRAIVMTTLEDEKALHNLTTAEEVASFWLEQGARDVVVKMGSLGCYIASLKTIVPALPGIEPIDTTGAGDSFNGTYLAGIILQLPPYDAAREAHMLAADVIRHRGAIIE
ncbi:sugar kinase [Saccharospirillum sp.]|uniref:sugar kinase n=1 Tax=Saccharospirillum sp. TaxID=2033801 RepID=UPI0034A01B92